MNVTAVSALNNFHLVTAATVNSNAIMAIPGQLNRLSGWATVSAYLKIFDKATAPVLGTDIPVMTIQLTANIPEYIDFALKPFILKKGLAIAITLNAADADATVLAAANTSGVDLGYSPQSHNS